VALACAPLAAALLTEGRWADGGARALLLVAFGLVLAVGAALALHRVDARSSREAEARERSLRQARDQQAATAEILAAIAASPPDLQRVLDTIARNAARVCDGLYAVVFRVDGTQIRLAAHHDLSPARLAALGQRYPRRLDDEDDEGPMTRAIRDASMVHHPDLLSDPGVPAWLREVARTESFRSLVIVPMLREGRPLGTLNVSRPEGGFSERQIQLLRTFADQAVIAIENVRLFTELQEKNRALVEAHARVTETLEEQTATAEILGVISSSPTDLAPVMAAVTQSAVRLARADHALIGEAADGRIRWLATSGCPRVSEGTPISRQLPSGRAILDCQTTQVEDVTVLTEDFPGVRRAYDELGVRTILATPLAREGQAIGVLLVRRTTAQPFSSKECLAVPRRR
jgi:two-component system, NtrC family, sensor kinase